MGMGDPGRRRRIWIAVVVLIIIIAAGTVAEFVNFSSGPYYNFINTSTANSELGTNFTNSMAINQISNASGNFPGSVSFNGVRMSGGGNSALAIELSKYNKTSNAEHWYSNHSAALIASNTAIYNDSYKGYIFSFLVSNSTSKSAASFQLWGVYHRAVIYIQGERLPGVSNKTVEDLVHSQITQTFSPPLP